MAYYIPPQGQGQPQIPPYPAPIIYYAAPAVTYQSTVAKDYVPHYARQTSTTLGAIQIVLACISIAAGGLAIAYNAELWEIGTGIWCGIFCIISGSIAIAAGRQPTNKLITATAVLSVFDILFGVAQLTIATIGVAEDIYCSNVYYYNNCPDWKGAAVTANSMMIGVGSLVIITGFWLMGVSCRAIDKGNKTKTVTLPVAYAATQPEAVFIQGPALQPQPLQGYYGPLQYPMMPNSQQIMFVAAQQAPPMIVKPEDPPPHY